MKYLEIKDEKAFFRQGEEMVEIDKIMKDDLLDIINHAHEDDFEMDQFNEIELPNKAHQIIYENLYNKLVEFLQNKEQFIEQANKLYSEAVQEYEAEIDNDEEESEDIEDEFHINPDDLTF